jgi:hypothetical protein
MREGKERADPDPTKLIPKNKIKTPRRASEEKERERVDPDPTKLIPKHKIKTQGNMQVRKGSAQIPTTIKLIPQDQNPKEHGREGKGKGADPNPH